MDIYNRRIEVKLDKVPTADILDHIFEAFDAELGETEFPLRFSIFEIKRGKKALVNVAVLRK
jgi:hypothetical protein